MCPQAIFFGQKKYTEWKLRIFFGYVKQSSTKYFIPYWISTFLVAMPLLSCISIRTMYNPFGR